MVMTIMVKVDVIIEMVGLCMRRDDDVCWDDMTGVMLTVDALTEDVRKTTVMMMIVAMVINNKEEGSRKAFIKEYH